MSRTRYAISWLYGEFRLARFHKEQVAAQWESPTAVESLGDLVRALEAASEHVDMTAKGDVIVVHEHDLHTHDYLEVPAMKKRDLEKYLARRVSQDKAFEDEAAWCYHKVRHAGGKEGVLLHLLPKHIVEATTRACTAVGLAPKCYVPLTEIVSEYMPTTDVQIDQMLLVVACFNERTELILTLADGEALFVRELNYGASPETADRLVTDINRTIRYTRQQVGRAVDLAWFMGGYSDAVMQLLEPAIEVPVRFDDKAQDPYFWARRATALSGKLSANFISVFEQKNMSADVLRRIGTYCTAAIVVITLLLTLISSGLVARRGAQKEQLAVRAEAVRSSINDMQIRLSESQLKLEHLERLRTSNHNLPSLMMVHLSRLTPPEVTLTEVAINYAGAAGWEISLTGQIGGDMRHSARILAGFEERLRGDPWRLRMTRHFTNSWMEQFEQGQLAETSLQGFNLVGVIQ